MSGLVINPFTFGGGGGGDVSYEYGMTELLATPSTVSSSTQQAGWPFRADAALSVVGLRMRGESVGDETLRLWDFETQNLLASVEITSAEGEWVEGLFDTPVTLVVDNRYIVTTRRTNAASRRIGYLNHSNVTFHADITPLGNTSYNNTDAYPGTVAGSQTYGMPDIIIEP